MSNQDENVALLATALLKLTKVCEAMEKEMHFQRQDIAVLTNRVQQLEGQPPVPADENSTPEQVQAIINDLKEKLGYTPRRPEPAPDCPPNAPVVILTAKGTVDALRRCGCRHLLKPYVGFYPQEEVPWAKKRLYISYARLMPDERFIVVFTNDSYIMVDCDKASSELLAFKNAFTITEPDPIRWGGHAGCVPEGFLWGYEE